MSLDRDELAARLAVADLSNPRFPNDLNDPAWVADWAANVARITDSLIARLAQSNIDRLGFDPYAPVTPAEEAAHDEQFQRLKMAAKIGKAKREAAATVAPVADAAPRPEWVRITSLPLGDDGRYPFAVGQVFKVAEWEDSAPRVIGPRREGITLSASGASIDPRHPGFATWEPCAAPAPSPAAAPDHPTAASFAARRGQGAEGDQHPAAYVPKVGDRVMHAGPDDGRRFVVTAVDAFAVIRVDSRRSALCVSGPWIDNAAPVYLGPATAAERAAAGLPPITPDHPQGGQGAEAEGRVGDQRVAAGLDAPASPAPAVDREGLAGVMRAAWYDEEAPWDEARPRVKADWLRAADAAIAFLKANGGVA